MRGKLHRNIGIALLALLSVSAIASFTTSRYDIKLESNKDRHNRYTNRGHIIKVRLLNQISSAPCIRGRSWGWDMDHVWVNNGCRGIFRIHTNN